MQFTAYVIREKSSGLYMSATTDSYGDDQYYFDISECNLHTAIQDRSLYMTDVPEFYGSFNIESFSNYEKVELKLTVNHTKSKPIKHIYTKVAATKFNSQTYFLTLGGHYPKQDHYRFIWSDGKSETHCHRNLEFVKSLDWKPLEGFTQEDIDNILC